jgi:hypothetical protein
MHSTFITALRFTPVSFLVLHSPKRREDLSVRSQKQLIIFTSSIVIVLSIVITEGVSGEEAEICAMGKLATFAAVRGIRSYVALC